MAFGIDDLLIALAISAGTTGISSLLGGSSQAPPTMGQTMGQGAPMVASRHPIFTIPTQAPRVITLGELFGITPATQRGTISPSMYMGGR